MNAPKLRFSGFNEEWKTIKFKSLFSEVNDKTGDTENYPLYSLTVQDGVTKKSDRYNREFLVKKEDNYKIVQPNYFVSNPMNMTIGALAQYKDSHSISVSGYYNVFKNISNYKNQFLEDFLKSAKMIWLYKSIATGSLIEKQRVHYSQFIELAVKLPDYKEANKIADFMELITNKIQLQQEKIDLLKEQKKGLMQKIFSQELRFKGDNNQFFVNWKEVELGDITVTFSGGTPSVSNRSYYTGNIPFIRSGEIHTDKTELYISETAINKSSAKMVENGDLLYALYGATSGEVAISQITGAINQAILCIRTDENKFFIKYWLENMKEQILNVYLQGGQGNLSASIIKSLKINLPHIEEQVIIANFFGTFDKKIQREEIKLNSLIKQKQSFMQQMFI